MNKTQEALKMAIKEMTDAIPHLDIHFDDYFEAINACKEALEQPAQEKELMAIIESLQKHIKELKFEGARIEQPAQEPFTWMEELQVEMYLGELSDGNKYCLHKKPSHNNGRWLPLYTHPHQWQGLTDDVIASIWMHEAVPMNGQDFKRVYRAIEQALKEKNT